MSKLRELQALAKQPEDSRPKESSYVTVDKANALRGSSLQAPSPTKDGASFLQSFLNATPLFNLFEYIADHTYGGDRIYLKVAKLKAVHPYFYQTCQWTDAAIRLVVVAILVIIAARAAFKIIS